MEHPIKGVEERGVIGICVCCVLLSISSGIAADTFKATVVAKDDDLQYDTHALIRILLMSKSIRNHLKNSFKKERIRSSS